MLECSRRTLQVALQEQPNAVVVPALPLGFLGDGLGSLSWRASGKNSQNDRVFSERNGRQIRHLFHLAGDGRGVAIKCKLTVVIRGGCLRPAGVLLRLPAVRKVRVPPGELAIA